MTTPTSAVGPRTPPTQPLDPAQVFSRRRLSEQIGHGPAVELDAAGHAYGWRVRRQPPATWPLHDATHTFRGGVVTGVLGRNGAGKSTLLDLVAGVRRPKAGSVRLRDGAAGEEVWRQPTARAAVTLVGTRPLLDARTSLEDNATRYALGSPLFSTSDLARYLAAFDLDATSQPARLSLGQRSAAEAAFALASHAPVLALDEVHLGMDAVVRRRFWDALIELYSWEHPTVLIASHDLDQIEDLLEDVVILDQGTITAAGSADDLREAATRQGEPLASLTDVLERATTKGDQR